MPLAECVYLDTSTGMLARLCAPSIEFDTFMLLSNENNIGNTADPDQMPQNAATELGLDCLHKIPSNFW